MRANLITLQQLDRQLSSLQKQGQNPIPKHGWVRTVRKALGMTIKQMAQRLQVNTSRVVKIETSEISGATTLHTLQSVAEALDCKFVYALVPNTSFEKTIKDRAHKIATEQIATTAHSMDLEAQTVDKKVLNDQVNALTYELLQKSWKHLWEQ